MNLVEFWTICSANGIVLDAEQRDQIVRFKSELLYWNKNVNLISRKDEENMKVRHLLHSMAINKYIEFNKKARVVDVGTGGGLPGIPVKIAQPDLYMTLIDSIAKKVKLARMFAQHTGLRNIDAMTIRAEEFAAKPENVGKFDFVISRAVAKTHLIAGWTKPLLKAKGKMVLLKGGNLEEEIKEAKEIFPNLVIEEQPIKFVGVDWFEQEEKKLLICHYEN